ncbi:porin [Paraburkholderia panacisoli]|uniref:Porin n=1 Tax=Paraburkholderia panacisoli TaxID=2603818 RepID=A0A5B0GKW7_9BURK|nr:porin [Paraburkholderia panacisoli]KAA1003445.1 porin [Paraburkholderia panacisoli]
MEIVVRQYLSGLLIALLLTSTQVRAQSDIFLYGILDTSLEVTNAGNGATVRMDSGGLNGSRFGLTGTEDIGAGYKIKFTLEQGILSTTGAASNPALAFSRQAWVGVAAPWGEVRVGLQNSPVYIPVTGVLDAFTVNTLASGMDSFLSISPRQNNAITYLSPDFHGLTGQVMVSLRDATTKPDNGIAAYNLAVEYSHGSLNSAIGYQRVTNFKGSSTLNALFAGANYAFGPLRVFAAYHNAKITGLVDKDVYALSASYQFSVSTMLSFGGAHAHDRTGMGNGGDQVGLMYWYFVSKRTTLYASAAFLDNHNKATFTINSAPTGGIPVAYPGANPRGIQLGIQHRF